ncbi:MAG: DUF4331 domain-containing protein [Proteobacteria bacterium]|nr:DUF4331 domain-containing protein [Pseudomonadota bacterium]
MNWLTSFLNFSLVVTLTAACGDDGGDNADAAVSTDMPALSAMQVDRAGRAAIATALQETFNVSMNARNSARTAYNQDTDISNWSSYVGKSNANAKGEGFIGSLAIFDALISMCGDHPLANINPFGADPAPPIYGGLAALLADDQLYVDTGHGTCTTYLAIELEALGQQADGDCGGRKPAYDVIDVSYSLLAAGATTDVVDGVSADADGPVSATFPFLLAPTSSAAR